MRNIGTEKAEVIKKHYTYQRYIMILAFMSAMVAGLVVLVLMKPAVTETYKCGKVYHVHSIEDGCYELVCTKTENEDGTPHEHSIDAGCYNLKCTQEVHIHDQSCIENNEEDEVVEVTEAKTEPTTVAATELPTEETTETEPLNVTVIENIDLGEIYALDSSSEKLSQEEADAFSVSEAGAYDFENDVEEITCDEESDIAEDTENTNAVKLTFKLNVPQEAFEDGRRTVYCELPDEISLGKEAVARKYVSGSDEVCRYMLDPAKNLLIVEFSEEQIGEGNCTVEFKFKFDAVVTIADTDSGNQTIRIGSASVDVPASVIESNESNESNKPNDTDGSTEANVPAVKGARRALGATRSSGSTEPSLSITKSVVDNGNGGYVEKDGDTDIRRIKVNISFTVYNGVPEGKDVIYRDKLDLIDTNGERDQLIIFDHTMDSSLTRTRVTADGTTETRSFAYNPDANATDKWYKYFTQNYIFTNLAEFVLDRADFYVDAEQTTPYSSVTYELSYYARINQKYTDHNIEYAQNTNSGDETRDLYTANYAEILYAQSIYKNPGNSYERCYTLGPETGNQKSVIPSQSLYRGYTISAAAASYNEKTDNLKWIITLKRGYDGYQITGDMEGLYIDEQSLIYADKLTVTNKETNVSAVYELASGEVVKEGAFGTFRHEGGKGTFTFARGTTANQYTLEYETYLGIARGIPGLTKVSCHPDFNRANSALIVQAKEVEVDIPKKRGNIIFDDSKANYDWKVTLQGTEGSFIVNGTEDDDEVTCNFDTRLADDSSNTDPYNNDQYLIPADTIENTLKLTFLDKDGNEVALERGTRGTDASVNKDYYLKWYSDTETSNEQTDISAILNGSVKIRGVRIGLNNTENAQKICDIIMEYKSYPVFNTATPIDSSIRFRNNIGWQQYKDSAGSSWKTKYVTEDKKRCYIVFDNTGNTAGAAVVYDDETDDPHYTADITDGDDMILTWGIEGNYSAVYSKTGDVTFDVTLPSGTKLIKEGTYAPTCSKTLSTGSQSTAFSFDYDEALNTVKFTVPADSRKDSNDNPVKFRLGYSVKLLSDVGSTGKSYTCDVTDINNEVLDQKQNVMKTYITKDGVQGPNVVPANPISGKTADLNENYVKSHVITYTVKVNPDAATLGTSGKIAVDDYMHYDLTKGYRPVLKSLTVNDMTHGGIELTQDQYTFTHRNSGLKASANERSNNASSRYSGATIYLVLDDSTYYEVTYVYHFKRNNSTDPITTESANLYNEVRLLADGTEYGYYKFDKEFTFGIYEDDESDDYAVIEAVDSTNNNKKVEGCYFAFLRYNNDDYNNSHWEIMTSAETDADGRILAKGWAAYEEITRGSTPEQIMDKYGLKKGSLPLLGPTGSNGRTRLPEISYSGSKDYMYRVVEILPNPNYTVNPDKVYGLGRDAFGMDGFPSNVFKDRVTSIYLSPGGSYDKQTGVVIIPNEPRNKRNITLKKEWADSQSTHSDVSFNLFRSYEAKTATITKTINFTLKDTKGNAKSTTIKAPYLGSFHIVIQNSQMFDQNSDFIFTVNGHTVTKDDLSDSEKQFAKYDNCTIRNRADDDEVIAYFTLPHAGATSYEDQTGITRFSNNADENADCSVWGNYVLKDLNIVLQAVDHEGTINNASFSASDFTTEEYDTFNNLPDYQSRLMRKINTDGGNDDSNMMYAITKLVTDTDGSIKEEYLPYMNVDCTVTLGNGNNWTYTWEDLPEKDCYGYKYFYYAEELPSVKKTLENGTIVMENQAESTLSSLYHSDYQIRYFNNGAFNGDTITVRNHEKSFIKTLPATGGEGADFIIGMGLSVISCAGITLFLRKRSSGRKRP